MRIIFDDKSYCDDVLSFEEAKERVYNCLNSDNVHKRTTKLSDAVSRETYPLLRKDIVVEHIDGFRRVTGKYALVIPQSKHQYSDWYFYLVDLNNDRFFNLGPTNGAILKTRNILRYQTYRNNTRYQAYTPKHVANYRVDKNGNITEKFSNELWFLWKTPDDSARMVLGFKEYKEIVVKNQIRREYKGCYMGFGTNNFITYIDQEEWETTELNIKVDLRKEDFPIDEQDLLLGLSFINRF